jgi:uncharacterized protein (DUF302 family)
LAGKGFGVFAGIGVKAALAAKLDEDMEDDLILGAGGPQLAHRAINVDRQIGLLLPCSEWPVPTLPARTRSLWTQ